MNLEAVPAIAPVSSALLAPRKRPVVPVQTLRLRERLSRERRLAKLESLHAQLDTWGQVALVLPLLDDADAIWDEFLDADAKRIRDVLRRLSPIVKEAHRLARVNTELHEMLRERQLVAKVVHLVLNEELRFADSYENQVRRWKTLARVHFRPWSMERVQDEIAAAATEMAQFLRSKDTTSSGMTFLGWKDTRRLDTETGTFQFMLDKTFLGMDVERHIATSWRLYTEQKLCSDVIFAGRARLSLDILQQVSPTVCLVHYVESYDDRPLCIHRLYMMAVVATETGVIQYMRSVAVPAVQLALSGPNDIWARDFFWLRWDVLDPSRSWNSTDYRKFVGGTMYLNDLAYLRMWLFSLVGAVLRSETASTGRPQLVF